MPLSILEGHANFSLVYPRIKGPEFAVDMPLQVKNPKIFFLKPRAVESFKNDYRDLIFTVTEEPHSTCSPEIRS